MHCATARPLPAPVVYSSVMSRPTAKTVVITGANSGIGKEVARKMTADNLLGHMVLLDALLQERRLTTDAVLWAVRRLAV